MEVTQSHRSSDVNILIVEDSATQAERLNFILEGYGYQLTAARNGREAIEAIQDGNKPSLILSDVVMPVLDGYQLCDYVKKDASLRHIPVILLTSLTDPADVLRGLECGADNFIFKPCDEAYLLARISFALANRHLREIDRTQVGLEILSSGQRYFITSDRMQILNLLLSTYEAAVEKNRSLATVTAELATKNGLLEIEIAERRRAEAALTEAKEEAERASTAKSDFLSHMSHELRTPLNAVIGYAQLLQLQSDDEQTLESAQAILRGGRHLLDLINEVLDLARIEAGKLTLSIEVVSVAGAIAQAVDLVRPILDERNIELSIESEHCDQLHVRADRQRLVQVLLNLLSNAAKYNRPAGRIEVRCSQVGAGAHRIQVTDTGEGLDAQAVEQLFKPFERGVHAEEGTGLGLALSRRLMELMGGELSLVSTGIVGSSFAVDLQAPEVPTAEKSAKRATREKRVTLAPGKLRIVYIEDNLSNILLMEKVLSGVRGIELLTAKRASEGLQLVEDQMPDLVLLDLHLPDARGTDVLRKLRANPKTGSIPVVVLSADASDNQIKRLLEAGAKTYLTKPIDLDLLFAELNDARSNLLADRTP